MKDLKLFGTCLTNDGTKVIILNWIFFSNNNFSEEFIIKKSLDNNEFKIIGKITKIIHSRRNFFYSFFDENIEYGNISYQISLRKKGPGALKKTILNSNIITINLTDNNPNIDNAITKMSQLYVIEAE